MSTLGGCGSHDAAGTRTDGPTRATQAPSPGKNPTDQPSRPTMPPARKPVLHVRGDYTYKVQILNAKTMVNLPNDPPPAGTKALALLLRVEAEPQNRSIHAPYADLEIAYPSLEADKNQHIGHVIDGATPYLTEDQMLFGGDGVEGIDSVFGTLQANTVYYHWVWQLVSEKADLTGASLCQVQLSGHNCIPIGAIQTDS
ncbi:hypothetical protein ACGFZB_24960 [Streptomyces cinerochromogenes]|uniref:Lipoprotein n=1 Tax=Streptomyces cinerochromogenes TaxID=66422 RepID=A0ABW7BA41_9ACTN